MLTGKKITVGIAGGIAAYKAAELVSGLVKNGADVRVVMTASAREFIQPLTFSALSGNTVYTDMFDSSHRYGVTHIELAQNADLLVVAPATANIIAKAANGIADDLLSTIILAANIPVMICPAMNTVMYNNPVVQQNIEKLCQLGCRIVGPNSGILACGAKGPGRMSEPREILQAIKRFFAPDLAGVNILVSAGPTREPLDPVRYLTNRSSGKMGYNLARAAAERGGNVVLVSGPVNLPPPAGVELIKVETAEQMRRAMLDNFSAADIVLKAAAVADYRPKHAAGEKIKKNDDAVALQLVKNPDILAELGQLKKHQILVGFAAETGNIQEYARKKLEQKNLDMIVANNVSEEGAGFDVDTNIVTIIYRNGDMKKLPRMSKYAVAQSILDEVTAYRSERFGK
ncbi:phosphopantothenoylcysteine decarboxylase/phosphopantothenate--cysteine ligase [Desulfohalotomaculum tongense]|uniref:bifunctional phosphopantothenoylcysteine decarboxylase/phosphopantothenate--cysteine ligase CoaBC n=1 Tax=Desulforadius tongensis TaxID=1216062 RepID=UPI001956F828|nr:phosphopantothenoylcysteine decarboxylase/phosphopantothenate--cysteine ligase [Desulforadius tongensis]